MQTKVVSQQRGEHQAWSSLSTVTSFDAGSSTVAVGMADNGVALQEINNFSPISLLIESLVEELCKLLANTPKKQKKLYNVICRKLHQMNLIDQSYNVEEFEFMRSHYQRALFHLLTVAKSATINTSESGGVLLQLPRYNFTMSETVSTSDWSRYSTEFEELEYIARGGFGRVYKARNKLDGVEYAIKKIYLQYRNITGFLQNLREVKMLAKLNHPNIVTYKAAWLEPMISRSDSQVPEKDVSDRSDISHTHKTAASRKDNHHSSEDDSGSIVFKNSDSKQSDNIVNVSIKPNNDNDKQQTSIINNHSGKMDKRQKEKLLLHSNIRLSDDSEDDSDISGIRPSVKERLYKSKITSIRSSSESTSTTDDSEVSMDKILVRYRRSVNQQVFNYWKIENSAIHHEWALLYVQMQLCAKTLRHWLDVRNAKEPTVVDLKQSVIIFQQIVSGVCYIHSQNIVHHDIKPSNIFVNHDLSQVQVGDFGLACCLQHSSDNVALMAQSSSEHSLKHKGEIGTKLYAAPEQLQGKCDSKSDLYSLGIILFELLQPFRTDMERCKLVTQLKTGHTPQELDVMAPKLAQLIIHLVCPLPADRPSANELQSLLVPLIKDTCNGAETTDSRNDVIQQLLAVISKQDREIEKLRQQLQEFQDCKSGK